MNKPIKHIILYDGDCGLCNKSVQKVLLNNPKKNIYFASLQSNYAKTKLHKFGLNNEQINSVVFVSNEKIYLKFAAVMHIAKHLKFPYKILGYFSFLPSILFNGFYDIIAKRRKKILNNNFCFIPNNEQQALFISDEQA